MTEPLPVYSTASELSAVVTDGPVYVTDSDLDTTAISLYNPETVAALIETMEQREITTQDVEDLFGEPWLWHRPGLLNTYLNATSIAMAGNMIRKGTSLRSVARAFNTRPEHVNMWRVRGEQQPPREPYMTFALVINCALASLETTVAESFAANAQRSWRGAAEFLGRRFPEAWRSTDYDKSGTTVVATAQAGAVAGVTPELSASLERLKARKSPTTDQEEAS